MAEPGSSSGKINRSDHVFSFDGSFRPSIVKAFGTHASDPLGDRAVLLCSSCQGLHSWPVEEIVERSRGGEEVMREVSKKLFESMVAPDIVNF